MIALSCTCHSLSFAIHPMGRIDVIASCMIFREPMCFSRRCTEIVVPWRYVSITECMARVCMVYKSIPGVGMQHHLRYSHILFQGFIFTSTSLLFPFARRCHYLFPSP